MAFFLRYCVPCNQTSTMVDGSKCPECGGPLKGVATHSLIEQLGRKLDVGQREDALAAALDDDIWEASDPRT